MGLTKYPEGSLAELWRISFPLMLSSLSVMAMIFINRLFLALYSPEAFTAAVSASTLGWSMILGWLVLTSISEVFVAQFNGAGQTMRLGAPVWQMIWLSCLSFFFFVPMAIFAGDWVYGSGPEMQLHRTYLHLMLLFGPAFPFYSALCGFFVGRGRVEIITWLALISNVMNAILDYVLIFGMGPIPGFGLEGAVFATCVSQIFQALVLFIYFLNQEHREECGTIHYRFDWPLFKQCLKIGVPGAVFSAVEMLGWAVFYILMTYASPKHILIAGIVQSIAILVYFFGEGISKGLTTIAGNLIGAKKSYLIENSLQSGMRLHLFFFCIMLAGAYFFSDDLAFLFLYDKKVPLNPDFLASLHVCTLYIILYMLFEGLRLLLAGALTAAGDTLFLLIAGFSSIWTMLVLPVYIAVFHFNASIETAELLCVFYGVGAALIYYYRFKSGKWKTLSITNYS